LFLRSRKRPVWTPKMASEVVRAVKKATMLMPAESCATPLPADAAEVDEAAAALLVVDDMTPVGAAEMSPLRRARRMASG